jgi:hypothetical protein
MKSTTLAQFLLAFSVAAAAPIADPNTDLQTREPAEWRFVKYTDYDAGAPPPGKRSALPEAEAEPAEWRFVKYTDYDAGAPPPGKRSALPEAEPTKPQQIAYDDYPPPGPDKRSAPANVE